MATREGEGRLLRLLAGTDLFKGLVADDLAACAARFREARFAKGQILFARGDPGTHLYLVAQGQVRLAIGTSEGRELSFQIAVPGDLLGEIAMLDGQPRSAEATALTPVSAYMLERSAFHELWSANATIANSIIAFLCWRLRNASDRLETIALYPMEVRLAPFFLVAARDAHGAPRGGRASG